GADPGLMGPVHAFLYDSRGMHDLGPLGGTESSARAINASGQIAGTTAVGSGSHAVMWDRGTVRDLGGLPGCPNTMATSINDSGQVVGDSHNSSWGPAFLADSGGMHGLGTLGGPFSEAWGINNQGQVVGHSTVSSDKNQDWHAFLYSGGVMTDLNDLLPAGSGWVLTEAEAINDAGQIAGTGMFN